MKSAMLPGSWKSQTDRQDINDPPAERVTEPREPAGYLVNHPQGVRGAQGVGYDYVIAGNGVFVQAESADLTARVQLAKCSIRGLKPTAAKIHLPQGKIPMGILEMGIHWFRQTPGVERYFAIQWDGSQYLPVIPEQQGRAASLSYHSPESAVLEFHSHGRMAAFFSGTDDRDEQGFRLYGVAGKLDGAEPEMRLRVGVYGHFQEIPAEEVFQWDDGTVLVMKTRTTHTPPKDSTGSKSPESYPQ